MNEINSLSKIEEGRNYRIDLLRMILVVFVIMGHMIEPLIDNALYKTIYLSIYLFHIPLFVGISGFLTPENGSGRIRSIMPILVPLIVFTGLYELYEILNTGHLSKYPLIVVPYWILWYLYSLICWRLLFPKVIKLRYPVVVTLVLSLLAGFIPLIGYGFGLSRTFYFFPFFLMGYYHRISNRAPLKIWPQSIFLNLLILMGIIFTMYHCRNMNEEWLYGSYSYSHFSSQLWKGPFIRLGVYLLSFAMSLSITSLMLRLPNRESPLSRLGVNTLYAYIWHGFVIKIAVDNNIISGIGEWHPLVGILMCGVISLLTALILTSGIVKKISKCLLFIPVSRLFSLVKKCVMFKEM